MLVVTIMYSWLAAAGYNLYDCNTVEDHGCKGWFIDTTAFGNNFSFADIGLFWDCEVTEED